MSSTRDLQELKRIEAIKADYKNGKITKSEAKKALEWYQHIGWDVSV